MSDLPIWLIIGGITLLLLVVFAIVWFKRKDKKQEPDYKTFFYLGIVWLCCGISIGNIGLLAMGIIFMALGIANKDKWKDKDLSKLSKEEKRNRMIIFALLGLMVLLGLVAFLAVEWGIF